jgi:hypothetical protein
MENASEALKMAGAMLIFVMALTITIISFTAARQASDSIVSTYGQLTTFYDYELYQNTGSYREVNSDEIVANLYSYYQTNNTILFYYLKSGSYSTSTKTFAPGSEIARMTLYYTPTSSTVPYTDKQQGKLSNLNKSFLRTKNDSTSREIYGADIQDETITRNEAWKGTAGDAKIFIDCLISGKNYENTNISRSNLNNSYTFYSDGRLTIKFPYVDVLGKPLNKASDRLFIERDGEYISTAKTVDDESETTEEKRKNSWKEVIANSTENLNDEVLENKTATTKKVIQYIYIPNDRKTP